MEASRNSFIPNLAVVQIVQIYTVGIRRNCAFFRSFFPVERRCKNTNNYDTDKIYFQIAHFLGYRKLVPLLASERDLVDLVDFSFFLLLGVPPREIHRSYRL